VGDGRIPTWSHVDERCAGFFALGVAKATGRPAAVACTSGTAAANFAPAVHEAAQAGVGLLVLTADRPRSCATSARARSSTRSSSSATP
jgi:2-succinyl-5-enolpyruvyl-6-hydroxy-3-cyclohexene-1-carboxylate synthase